MTPDDIERLYDALAETLDKVGPAKSELFLAKLVLLISNDVGDAARVLMLIEEARMNLDASD